MSHSAMPPYYTWIVDKVLAVSALPYHHTHLNYLSQDGIQTVVSILDQQFRSPFHTNPKLKVIHLNTCVTLSDCHEFVQLMERAKLRGEGVLVHSEKGLDTAAALVACYLVKLWEAPSDYVIDQLRMMRPTSLRLEEHESLVHRYYGEVAHTFRNYYADTSLPRWGQKTAFLGQGTLDDYVPPQIPESYQERNPSDSYGYEEKHHHSTSHKSVHFA